MTQSLNRFLCLLFVKCLMYLPLSGQGLQTSVDQLQFGVVQAGTMDSLPLKLYNPLGRTVQVQALRFYDTYGQAAFSAQTPVMILAPGDSQNIWVRFAPRHNIEHRSELIIYSDAHRGTQRIDLLGQGQYEAYYSTTRNLSEQALKDALKARLAQGYVQLSYNFARDQMFMVIDNQKVNGRGASQNTLQGVYTGFTVTNYATRTEAQLDGIDTEHTFPQGTFSQNLPMRTDLHHLFPTKKTANSTRSNFPFAEVPSGSVVCTNPTFTSRVGNGRFEPHDGQKGNTARAMLYFLLRYQNYQSYVSVADEQVLRQWHQAFPPESIAIRRNNDIATVQGNRNPLIDHPEFIERISSFLNNAVAPVQHQLDFTEALIDFDTVFANISIDYDYWLVNNGNQPTQISQLSLSHPYLQLVHGTQRDTTLQPGEALLIRLRLNAPPGSQVQDTLRGQTDDPNWPDFAIPVQAQVSWTQSVEPTFWERIRIYPQPALGELFIELPESQSQPLAVSLWTLDGKAIHQAGSFRSGTHTISLSMLPSGPYLVQLSQGDKVHVTRIWKR